MLVCVSIARGGAWSHPAANRRVSAPDFRLKDSTGAAIQLSAFRGKVVLLDFWATWCHGCQLEIPWYVEFEKKYKDQGLVVIGVSMDDDGWKSVRPYLAQKHLNYPVVIGSQSLAARYGLESMPLTLLIDRSGKIADSHAGVVDRDVWEQEIQTLLEKGRASR